MSFYSRNPAGIIFYSILNAKGVPLRLLQQILLCIFVCSACICNARESIRNYKSPLSVIVIPISWSRDYDPERDNFAGPELTAGSYALLIIHNKKDFLYEVSEYGWPVSYTIEAGLDFSYDEEFIPSKGLFQRMYFKGEITNRNRSHLQIAIRIPEDIIGHSLSFKVVYDTGDTLISQTTISPIHIIEASSKEDQAQIFSSLIYVLFETEDYEGAIEIGDLMINTDYTFARGWYFAHEAAMRMGRYDKMILFLEKLWNDYGVISANSVDPNPEYNPQGKRDPKMEAVFKEQITNLKKALSDQQSDTTK